MNYNTVHDLRVAWDYLWPVLPLQEVGISLTPSRRRPLCDSTIGRTNAAQEASTGAKKPVRPARQAWLIPSPHKEARFDQDPCDRKCAAAESPSRSGHHAQETVLDTPTVGTHSDQHSLAHLLELGLGLRV